MFYIPCTQISDIPPIKAHACVIQTGATYKYKAHHMEIPQSHTYDEDEPLARFVTELHLKYVLKNLSDSSDPSGIEPEE